MKIDDFLTDWVLKLPFSLQSITEEDAGKDGNNDGRRNKGWKLTLHAVPGPEIQIFVDRYRPL